MTMISRHILPQISEAQIEEFKSYLAEKGIGAEYEEIPANQLKPIQSEVNRSKIESLRADPEACDGVCIVSKSGYLMDGHHRWLAKAANDVAAPMKCLRCDCTINELFALAHKFEGSFRKSVHEVRLVNFIPNRFF